MLTGTGIEAGYLRSDPVLRAVDIQIAPGEVVRLAGPSGCGKSTLARVLAFLLAPWSGRVDIDGAPAARVRYQASRQQRTAIGVVFQQPRLSVDPRLTLREAIVELLRACKRRLDGDQIAELTDRVGLPPSYSVVDPTKSVTVNCNELASPAPSYSDRGT